MSTKIGEIELLKPLAVGTMAWGRTWLDNKLNRGAFPRGRGDGGWRLEALMVSLMKGAKMRQRHFD